MNFVAGYNEFFRAHLQGVFKILRVIPKKNFTADIYTIKEIKRVVKAGGNIMLFPEYDKKPSHLSSISPLCFRISTQLSTACLYFNTQPSCGRFHVLFIFLIDIREYFRKDIVKLR